MYGKGFSSMYTGSMMGAGLNVFAVWNYAINNADRQGFLEMNPRLLAVVLGGPIEQIESALEYLTTPDPKSRSKVEDGRRLVREGEYLYRLVNYEHYRGLKDTEARREYLRLKAREYRASKSKRKKVSTHVDGRQSSTASTTIDKNRHIAEAEAEVDGKDVRSKSVDLSSNKISSSAVALAKPPIEPDVLSWSREACDDWIERFGGTAPGGQIGKFLKPLVKRHGWPVVRSAWRSYLAQSEAQYASPSRFSGTFGKWAGLIEDPEKPDEVMAHNERFLKGVVDRMQSQGRELGNVAGLLPSMPKARR